MTENEIPGSKDPLTSVDLKMQLLSQNEDQVRPLETSDFGLGETSALRRKLKEIGFNTDITPECRKVLVEESQFRNDLSIGRGPGMVDVMGEEKTKELREWCHHESLSWKKLKDPETGTTTPESEGRGMQQLACDLITITTCDLDTDELNKIVERINKRVLKGLYQQYGKSSPERQGVKEKLGITEDYPKTLASVPPGKAQDVFAYLFKTK